MPRKVARPALTVVRLHEATGASPKNWDAAVRDAIARARKEVQGEVVGFEVVRLAGEADTRKIRGYRATVRVAFRERVRRPPA